jgi:phosphoglycerate kinase
VKRLEDIPESAKAVLVRVDYNVPLSEGKVTDDSRIVDSLPTLKWLLDHKKRVAVVTHLGRPDGTITEDMRVDPVAARLAELLERPVAVLRHKPSKDAAKKTKTIPAGEVVLLENIRFYPEEEDNDAKFAEVLAVFADVFVNEAFSVSHRAHASVVGVTQFLPAFAGLRLAEEVERLTRIRDARERPFALILGGKKLNDKIPLVERFIGTADVFIFGGGVGNTFARAEDSEMGRSLVDEQNLVRAQAILKRIRDTGAQVVIPMDFVYEDSGGTIRTASRARFPFDGFAGDIGEQTRAAAIHALESARSVFWNGPLGIFEKKGFEDGSLAVLDALSHMPAYRVGGGGDTLAMVKHFGMQDAFDYISSAGGAAIEFLAGIDLPGLTTLMKPDSGETTK